MRKAEESKNLLPPHQGKEIDYRGEFLRALRRREWSRTIKQPKGNPQDFPTSAATASAVTA